MTDLSESARSQNVEILLPRARKFYDENGAVFAEVHDDLSVTFHHPVTSDYSFSTFIRYSGLIEQVKRHIIYKMYPGPVCTNCALPANERYYYGLPEGVPDPGHWRCPQGHIFHPTEVK